MTKENFVDYIIALVQRIDKTSKYHPQVVAYSVEMAVNNVLCDMFLRMPNMVDPYIKTYTGQSAVRNASTDLLEITLYNNYVPLPVVGSGVREVALDDDSTLTFVPVRYDDLMRIIDLNANYMTDVIYYAVVDNKIVLSSTPDEYSEMRVRMLTSFADYLDDDNFIVPHGQNMAIMQNVLQILGIIPPVDLYNNNSEYGRGQRFNNS